MDLDLVLSKADDALHSTQRVLDSHDRAARGLDEILQRFRGGCVIAAPAHVEAIRNDLAGYRMEAATVWGELAHIRDAIAKLRRDVARIEGE